MLTLNTHTTLLELSIRRQLLAIIYKFRSNELESMYEYNYFIMRGSLVTCRHTQVNLFKRLTVHNGYLPVVSHICIHILDYDGVNVVSRAVLCTHPSIADFL